MRIKNYLAFAILFGALGLLLTGCSEDGNSTGMSTGPTIDDIREYFPLGMDYTWTYNSYFAGGGFDSTITRTIIGSHLFNSGITVYFEEMPPDDDYMGWASADDGIYVYVASELDEQYLYLIMSNPPGTDATLTIDNEISFTILSLDTEVTCPAGTFSCIKLEVAEIDGGLVQLYYLAKDIGLVRWEDWYNWEFLKHYELSEYDLNN
jgi:hypothetical protein